MKKAAYDKKKLNNAGMTLVEILVAIAILSVAIVPLMYSFVYAAKHNAKARDMQQTSVFAHTVIENCKAYSMEEIEKAITDPTSPNYPFLKNTATAIKVNDGLYYFDDVTVYADAASGYTSNQVYDIAMTITPHGGSQTMMSYETMNAYTDAVFMAESTLSNGSLKAVDLDGYAYDTAITAIQSSVKSQSKNGTMPDQPGVEVLLTTEEIKNSFKAGGLNYGRTLDVKRNISVSAANAGGINAYDYAKVVYTYTFSITGNKFEYEYTDPTTGATNTFEVDWSTGCTVSDTFDIYNNTNTKDKAELENIYLFYYPAYNQDTVTEYPCSEDKISITNGLGRELNVYLMKQKNPYMTDIEIETGETNYSPKVTGSGSTIHLYNNLRTNVSGVTGGSVSWIPGNATGVTLKDYDRNPDPLVTELETLVDIENKQLMYQVKVQMYENTAVQNPPGGTPSISGDVLAEMSGTFLNW